MPFPSKTSPDAIRAAAIEVLENEGQAALTLRRIAAVLGVAPNALYRYYGSRDLLIAAVADEVARRLLSAINEGLERGGRTKASRPEDAVRIFADVHVRFADSHPSLYQCLMTDTSAAEAALPQPLAHDQLWLKAIEVMAPLTGETRAPLAAITLWSLLHGMWVLKRSNLLGGKKPMPVEDFAMDALLKGLAM